MNTENGKPDKSEKGLMLVALDGSPSSITALEWAAKHASGLKMNIEVVNVWEHVDSTLMVAGMGFGADAYVGESDPKAWSDRILEGSVADIFGTGSDRVKKTSIEGGVVRTLVEMTKDADLLVMGSRGHGKFTDLILGTVSTSCTAKSKCPVLIVHAPASTNS